MKLIIILICLIGFRYMHVGRTPNRYNWFRSYVVALHNFLQALKSPWLITILILLPIMLVILLLQLGFAHGIFYVLEFFLGIFILWYCLWPISLEEYLESSLAKLRAANDASPDEINDEDAVQAGTDTRAVIEAMLCHANSRTFAVLFWFIVLGPCGAILYRTVAQFTKLSSRPQDPLNGIARCAHILEDLLDWIPARLVGLGYALAGNFTQGFAAWMHHVNGGLNSNQDLLISSGVSAMDFDPDGESNPEQARQVLRLINRSLVVWLVVIAIFTLGAWLY